MGRHIVQNSLAYFSVCFFLTLNIKMRKMVTTVKSGASKKSIETILKKVSKELKPKGINAHKYLGKVKLSKNPLDIQKELRNEWE